MKLFHFGAAALTLGLTLSLVAVTGCSSNAPSTGGTSTDGGKTDGDKKDGTSTAGSKKGLVAGKGVIKGQVTFDGPEPDTKKMTDELVAQIKEKSAKDAPHCLDPEAKEDAKEQQWRINAKNKGVQNVVVFLTPEKGTFFACDKNDEGVKAVEGKPFDLKQPYCAFEPHTFVLFPEYRDKGDKRKSTNEVLRVHNDTNTVGDKKGIGHNTKWEGVGGAEGNQGIEPGKHLDVDTLVPSLDRPMTINCTIHPFMKANAWVLNHPYWAVTDADGNFEIKNVPAGKVQVRVWHEVPGFVVKDEVLDMTDGKPQEKNFKVTDKK